MGMDLFIFELRDNKHDALCIESQYDSRYRTRAMFFSEDNLVTAETFCMTSNQINSMASTCSILITNEYIDATNIKQTKVGMFDGDRESSVKFSRVTERELEQYFDFYIGRHNRKTVRDFIYAFVLDYDVSNVPTLALIKVFEESLNPDTRYFEHVEVLKTLPIPTNNWKIPTSQLSRVWIDVGDEVYYYRKPFRHYSKHNQFTNNFTGVPNEDKFYSKLIELTTDYAEIVLTINQEKEFRELELFMCEDAKSQDMWKHMSDTRVMVINW